jgi:hypothetical protein
MKHVDVVAAMKMMENVLRKEIREVNESIWWSYCNSDDDDVKKCYVLINGIHAELIFFMTIKYLTSTHIGWILKRDEGNAEILYTH